MTAPMPAILTEPLRQMCEQVWDAAVASLRREDGSPVEIVSNANPYRAATTEGAAS